MATTPQQLIDITTRHAVYLERLKSHEAKEALKTFDRISQTIRGYLNDKAPINEWTSRQLTQYMATLRKLINKDLLLFESSWNESLNNIMAYEAEFELKALGDVADHTFKQPNFDQISAAVMTNPLSVQGANGGKLLPAFYKDWTERETDRIVNTVRLGYFQGDTTASVVRSIVGTKASGYTDGIVATSRRAAEGFVRTAIQHSAVQAREKVWDRNKDIVKKVRWVSTLDSRTTTLCKSLDGQEFDIDKGPRPPAHVNCRSTIVPVLDDRFKLLDEGATRAARDSQDARKINNVPADETYYTWLKRQPKAFQDNALGERRAKLFRDGGLTAERFRELQLDKRFNPLTLDEMRAIEPTAFERANL